MKPSAYILPLLLLSAMPANAMTLKTLEIPGDPEFVREVREILDVRYTIRPNDASDPGLFEDAVRVPSFSPASVKSMRARLKKSLAAMRKMPWRDWAVDRQIDFRWIYALGEEADRVLGVEKRHFHRPSMWLEGLANNWLALVTYAPERKDLRDGVAALVPAMVEEMRAICTRPTQRDVEIADGILKGLLEMLADYPEALAPLKAYKAEINALSGLPPYHVVGRKNYEWRLKRALLLPWDAKTLREMAYQELTVVDTQRDALKPHLEPMPQLTPEQKNYAKNLSEKTFLALYDDMVREQWELMEQSGMVTVLEGVGPMQARPTPTAMIPLTGDGGSMNPPATFAKSNVGYWNVENFKEAWDLKKREEFVRKLRYFNYNDYAPYSAHEAMPGHHLQLSIARLNPNPLRSITWDSVMVEGWALYGEEALWKAGGMGPTVRAHDEMLASWRFRIRRVVYDVNIETGKWSVQEGTDWKHGTPPGKTKPDPDVLRTVNWPTQLIGYFTGKMQIRELKAACKQKWGKDYSDRRFHDEFLSVGSLPVALIRAKLLGEPVPGI